MIGSTILHYEILELLGRGAMGAVYKARDTRLDTFRALKFLHLELSSREIASAHFIREARTQAKLMHPNIATLLALEMVEDSTFLVMEYVDGIPLDDYLDREKPPVRERLGILMQVANALSAAHAMGIIHRDIKPKNVLVGREGTVKVTDFGLAKAIGQTDLSRTGETKGSAFYMPPEAFKGGGISSAADVWALGVLTHQVLEGEPPFKGEVFEAIAYQIIQEPHPQLSGKLCEVLPGIDLFLDGCLEKDPDKRTQSGNDAFQELTLVARSAGFTELLEISAPAIRRKPKRGMGRLLYSAAGVIALVVLAAVLFTGRRPVDSVPVLVDEHSALANESDPSWSPDGTRFAYLQGTEYDSKTLVIRSVQEGVSPVLEDLPPELRLGTVVWSPDEKVMAITGSSGVFLYNLETKEIARVTDHSVQQPSWSSDGRWLIWGNTWVEDACLERIGPVEPDEHGGFTGYTPQHIDFGDVPAFDSATAFYCPVYILGDTKIAFVASRLADNLGIWVVDMQSGEVMQSMAGEPFVGWDMVWDERGRRIFFREDMGEQIYQVSLDENGRCAGDVQPIGLGDKVSGFDYDPVGNKLVLLTTVDSYHLWEAPLEPVPGDFSPLITRYYQTMSPVYWRERNAVLFSAVDTKRGVVLQAYNLNTGEISDLHPPNDQYGNEYAPTLDPLEDRFVIFLGMIGGRDTGVLCWDLRKGQIGELVASPEDGSYMAPYWSFDGASIFLSFYTAGGDRDREIRRLSVIRSSDGLRAGEIETILKGESVGASYQGADGRYLIFSTSRDDTRFLDILDLTDGEVCQLTEGRCAALDPTRRDLYYLSGTSVWRIRNWAEYFGRQAIPERVVDLPQGVVQMGLSAPMCIGDTAVYAVLRRTDVGYLKVYQLPR